MARKRMVSPELLTSLAVASMPIATRYAFVGLWMYLDDCGRGRDHAGLIRAHTWPLDPSYSLRKVRSDLDRMVERGLVCRYDVDGMNYLHIPSWFEHQTINRPTPSKIPPCAGHEPEAWKLFTEDSLSPHGWLTEDSLPKEVKRREEKLKLSEPGGSACEHGADRPGLCALCRRGITEDVG